MQWLSLGLIIFLFKKLGRKLLVTQEYWVSLNLTVFCEGRSWNQVVFVCVLFVFSSIFTNLKAEGRDLGTERPQVNFERLRHGKNIKNFLCFLWFLKLSA